LLQQAIDEAEINLGAQMPHKLPEVVREQSEEDEDDDDKGVINLH